MGEEKEGHHLGPSFGWSLQAIIMESYFICNIFQCKKKNINTFQLFMCRKKKDQSPLLSILNKKFQSWTTLQFREEKLNWSWAKLVCS